jgi:hypothetical protein
VNANEEHVAADVLRLLGEADATAISGGYAVMRGGARRLFPPARTLAESRDKDTDRVLSGTYLFPDGSVLKFRRNGRSVAKAPSVRRDS